MPEPQAPYLSPPPPNAPPPPPPGRHGRGPAFVYRARVSLQDALALEREYLDLIEHPNGHEQVVGRVPAHSMLAEATLVDIELREERTPEGVIRWHSHWDVV